MRERGRSRWVTRERTRVKRGASRVREEGGSHPHVHLQVCQWVSEARIVENASGVEVRRGSVPSERFRPAKTIVGLAFVAIVIEILGQRLDDGPCKSTFHILTRVACSPILRRILLFSLAPTPPRRSHRQSPIIAGRVTTIDDKLIDAFPFVNQTPYDESYSDDTLQRRDARARNESKAQIKESSATRGACARPQREIALLLMCSALILARCRGSSPCAPRVPVPETLYTWEVGCTPTLVRKGIRDYLDPVPRRCICCIGSKT